jgi:hypothetical protein
VGAEVARSNSPGLFQFAALININLAVVNILPLPALDGALVGAMVSWVNACLPAPGCWLLAAGWFLLGMPCCCRQVLHQWLHLCAEFGPLVCWAFLCCRARAHKACGCAAHVLPLPSMARSCLLGYKPPRCCFCGGRLGAAAGGN